MIITYSAAANTEFTASAFTLASYSARLLARLACSSAFCSATINAETHVARSRTTRRRARTRVRRSWSAARRCWLSSKVFAASVTARGSHAALNVRAAVAAAAESSNIDALKSSEVRGVNVSGTVSLGAKTPRECVLSSEGGGRVRVAVAGVLWLERCWSSDVKPEADLDGEFPRSGDASRLDCVSVDVRSRSFDTCSRICCKRAVAFSCSR